MTPKERASEIMGRQPWHRDIDDDERGQREIVYAIRAAVAEEREACCEAIRDNCRECAGTGNLGHDRSVPPNPYICDMCTPAIDAIRAHGESPP